VVRHCRAQEHAARRIDPPTVGYSERVEVITANGHSLQALMYSIDAGKAANGTYAGASPRYGR
jgi:hypothetical protein